MADAGRDRVGDVLVGVVGRQAGEDPITTPPASAAPLEAASITPARPPQTSTAPASAIPRPTASASPRAAPGRPRRAPITEICDARLTRPSPRPSREHPPHQLQRAALVEVLVQVAALRALHAGGAAVVAGALADQAVGVADQALELLVAAPGDADAAGVAVVDEDRRRAGLVVDVGREAADVPAVAHRDQRQHRDLAVLGGVQRAEQHLARQRRRHPVADHVPERLGDEVLLGQVERDDVDHLVVAEALALVGDHLLGDRDRAEAELHAERPALRLDLLDVDLGLLLHLRVVVAVERLHHRPPRADVELGDLVGAAEVQVDRAGVDRREGALGLDLAEHLAGGRSRPPRRCRPRPSAARSGRRRSRRCGSGSARRGRAAARPSSPAARPARASPRRGSRRRRARAAPRRRRRPGAASGSARSGGRGSPPRPGARGTRRGGGRRTGRARPRRRRRRRARGGGGPRGPTSGAGWRRCRGS